MSCETVNINHNNIAEITHRAKIFIEERSKSLKNLDEKYQNVKNIEGDINKSERACLLHREANILTMKTHASKYKKIEFVLVPYVHSNDANNRYVAWYHAGELLSETRNSSMIYFYDDQKNQEVNCMTYQTMGNRINGFIPLHGRLM